MTAEDGPQTFESVVSDGHTGTSATLFRGQEDQPHTDRGALLQERGGAADHDHAGRVTTGMRPA